MVKALKCRFCEFGKCKIDEDDGDRKRQRTEKPRFFVPPFRPDNMKRHLNDQHSKRYNTYSKLNDDEKRQFFVDIENARPMNVMLQKTAGVVATGSIKGFDYIINKDVVEVIIANLLCDNEEGEDMDDEERDVEEIVENALTAVCNDDRETTHYLASFGNVTQFSLIVSQVSNGSTFRLCANVIQSTKEILDLAELGNICERKVIQAVRVTCAINFNVIRSLLDFIWAYSIAIDGGTKGSVPYLDIRLRFVFGGKLHNIHLVALPMHDSHTGENMFLLVSRFLDALNPNWRSKLLSVASDGASSMLGRFQGIVTRLDNVCLGGFYRIWCGSHQLDLVIQSVFVRMLSGTFVEQTQRVTGYLRRQINLKQRMKTQCPKFVSTRWLSMERLLTWLVKHRLAVEDHMNEKNPTCKPDVSWWIMVHLLKNYTETVNVVARKIQSLTTLVSSQEQLLKDLVVTLKQDGFVKGPTNDIEDHNEGRYIGGLYYADIGDAEEHIENSDLFVLTSMRELKNVDRDAYISIINSVCIMYVATINGITNISIERDHMNRPTHNLPSVLPKELLSTSRANFNELLLRQKERLLISFNEKNIVDIEESFKLFKTKARVDKKFLEVVEKMDDMISFDEGWESIGWEESPLCNF